MHSSNLHQYKNNILFALYDEARSNEQQDDHTKIRKWHEKHIFTDYW